MEVRFHPDAEAEFIAAAEFYEAQATGLGLDFIVEVQHALEMIVSHPGIGHLFSRQLRRILVRRFPYGLLYISNPDGIFIAAVMHLHRRPNYWKGRA